MAHILVVDDDKDLCTLLKTALERDGLPGVRPSQGKRGGSGGLPLGRLYSAGCHDAGGGWLCPLPPDSEFGRLPHPFPDCIRRSKSAA